MPAMPPAAHNARAGSREWLGLAVLTLPCLVYALDLTILNFAVPQLTRHLQPSAAQLLWIIDIYGFMVAGFLVTMGTLGDRIGRRRLLLIGAAVFGLASLLAAFARSPAQLIAARALLGVAGATLAPSTLSLIRNMFHDESQRRAAIAVWMAGFSAGTALGPITGGLLLEHFWWGSVFLVNVPVMALLVALGAWLLPEFRSDTREPLDFVSAVLSLIAVLPIVWGIKQIAAQGFSAQALPPIIMGLVIGFIFLRRQRALAHPFVDLSLFGARSFRAALLANVGGAFFIAGIHVFVAQYLQLVQGLSPLRAALWSMPSALTFILVSTLVPVLARRYSQRQLMTVGLVIAALGFALLLGVRADGPIPLLVAGLMVFSLGYTPVASLTTDHIVSSAPPERAGGAAALSETAFELGAALGIALLGSLGAAIFRARMMPVLPPALDAVSAQTASATLGGAVEIAAHNPALAQVLLEPARIAFTSALLAAAGIGMVCLLAMALQVNRALR
jgi:DHA2 family multidrug resistance protein-like MFS transporter